MIFACPHCCGTRFRVTFPQVVSFECGLEPIEDDGRIRLGAVDGTRRHEAQTERGDYRCLGCGKLVAHDAFLRVETA